MIDFPNDAKVMNFSKEKAQAKEEKNEKSSLRESIQTIKNTQTNEMDKDKSAQKKDSHER